MWIYCIRNDITEALYIGQTKYEDVETRWNEHRAALRKGKHFNEYLQRAWKKHGELAFSFETVSWCNDVDTLNALEEVYIHRLSEGGTTLYNLAAGGAFRLNKEGKLKHKQATNTPEFKAKISQIHSGKIISEEHKQRLREANQGKTLPPEVRAKIAASNTGKKLKPLSEEQKEHLRQINLGKKYGPMSEEQKEKISRANMGRKISPESIAKMIETRKGKPGIPHTEESKEKLRQSALGRKMSPEAVAKRTASRSRLGNASNRKGSKHTEETKEKLRVANLGKKLSAETIEKRTVTYKANKARKKELV